MLSYFKSKGQDSKAFTIAFYNLENLFDTTDDPSILDDHFTSNGRLKWSQKKYHKKIKKLSKVIKQIGLEKSFHPPIILGIAEVENKAVLNDLIHSKDLKGIEYDYVHYNSPDERGIDVGLIYNKQFFELIDSKVFPLLIDNTEGERDLTRDVLLVKGKLNGELMHILVNHWPSRRDGAETTEYKRVKAAELNRQIINDLRAKSENPKIIIMGDFNDGPTTKSIKETLVQEDLYNPMESLYAKGNGSLKYKKDWFLFDQIIFSKNFMEEKENEHSFKYAEIFSRDFLKVFRGKNKGMPYRTFIGRWYQGGYSDHFPVLAYLKKN